MRLVEWLDEDGYKHLSWIKDNDLDISAPKGIKADPPILDQIDWKQVEKELHNALVERRLSNWQAVMKSQSGVNSTIISVLKRKIVALYRSAEKEP